jgi:signal transduction histidine kinase
MQSQQHANNETHRSGEAAEIIELPLLVHAPQVAALERMASQQGLSMGTLIRRLITAYLGWREPEPFSWTDATLIDALTHNSPEEFTPRTRPRPDPSPRYLGSTGATASQRTEKELATDWFAQLGHELRNPLAALRSALELLRQHGSDPRARALVENVLDRQTQQMNSLLDNFLDLARLGKGKVQLRTQTVDLATAVRQAIDTVRPALEARGHALQLILPRQPISLLADPTRLEQILTNLLSNAIKYTEPGGRIAFIVETEPDEIVLHIADTGVGISAQMLPHVFDLYAQSSRTADHSEGGLGIGLALVRCLVEMHGGRVQAFSAGPGQGSDFVLRLPRTRTARQDNGAGAEKPS